LCLERGWEGGFAVIAGYVISLPHLARTGLKAPSFVPMYSTMGSIIILILTVLFIKSLLPLKQRRWPTTPYPYDD
jgi:hypothetical protein